jgi:aryl-alcohol dehydrogenase-like predicted oxidoreductase
MKYRESIQNSSPDGPIARRNEGVTRREFVKLAVAGGMAAGVGSAAWGGAADGTIPTRALGRTGEKVSAIGLGGWHIGSAALTEPDSISLIRKAIDNGITFLDNCWDYNGGASEIRMGKALQDGYRAKAFLMTKIDGRTKAAAARQIEESLKRLQTDRIDLLQFHEIIRLEDPGKIFATGGGLEAAVEARKAGKIRFIGFTGHKDPSMHLKMLDTAAEHKFHFDAVQMPLNVMDAHFRSFEKNVVPRLVKEETGVLGMKSLAFGAIPRNGAATAIECLHYAMNLPTSVVITGCDSMKLLDQALEAGRTFQPLQPAEVAALLARTKDAAANGQYEAFKTSTTFDGTTQNPQWLG